MKYNEWPTLGEKIDSGKRIVLFLEYAANTTQVDIILPEFDVVRLRQHECTLSPYMCTYQPTKVLHTPRSGKHPTAIQTLHCSANRISDPLTAEDHMYMINHSLNNDILRIENASTTNNDTSCLLSSLLLTLCFYVES